MDTEPAFRACWTERSEPSQSSLFLGAMQVYSPRKPRGKWKFKQIRSYLPRKRGFACPASVADQALHAAKVQQREARGCLQTTINARRAELAACQAPRLGTFD